MAAEGAVVRFHCWCVGGRGAALRQWCVLCGGGGVAYTVMVVVGAR